MSTSKWDQKFNDEDFIYGEIENEFINEKSDIIPANSKVACFAEGEGRNAVYLATMGHNVTAFDQSTVGLKKAEKLAATNNVQVETVATDLTKEEVGKELYDAAIMVFGHVAKADQPYFLENIFQSVKKGGTILIEVYSESQLDYETGGPKTVEMLYSAKDILKMTRGYKREHFYYGEVERNEGKGHVGTGHVIQVVVRK
ncbi:class I SAM-dependent methyltransferase [Halalkalibacillus halophilus]|uniref:class I SAM-dependent methyltransferase n=1 Tax=Halalkalibacillus halophilus TaxID=392827 RepID=UPI000403CA35|nr:class I SAM-dependent methyltransferase [Halalkalibacillus halophilus]